MLKFRFSEKATKIWQNLPLILMLLSKHQHKFFKFCGLLIKWFLNYKNMALHIFKFFNIIKCFYLSSQQTQFVVSNFSAIVFLARFYQKVEWSALKGYLDNTGIYFIWQKEFCIQFVKTFGPIVWIWISAMSWLEHYSYVICIVNKPC